MIAREGPERACPRARPEGESRSQTIVHTISAWDGLQLVVREWRGGDQHLPILCLPGIVRTSGDFAALARAIGTGRRVIAPDYAGRGQSGRARDVARYAPEACLRDVLDICAALHLPRLIAIGTSFGGLLSMGLAAMRPSLLRAVVLNDIGPELANGGVDFVRRFIGTDSSFPDLDTAVAHLQATLPPLSLHTDEAWRGMAALTYAPDDTGSLRPRWDTRIARLLSGGTRDLWPLFEALAHVPIVLVRGELSDILLPDTVERMRLRRPDLVVVSLPGIGHAPTLAEPDVIDALRAFLDRIG